MAGTRLVIVSIFVLQFVVVILLGIRLHKRLVSQGLSASALMLLKETEERFESMNIHVTCNIWLVSNDRRKGTYHKDEEESMLLDMVLNISKLIESIQRRDTQVVLGLTHLEVQVIPRLWKNEVVHEREPNACDYTMTEDILSLYRPLQDPYVIDIFLSLGCRDADMEFKDLRRNNMKRNDSRNSSPIIHTDVDESGMIVVFVHERIRRFNDNHMLEKVVTEIIMEEILFQRMDENVWQMMNDNDVKVSMIQSPFMNIGLTLVLWNQQKISPSSPVSVSTSMRRTYDQFLRNFSDLMSEHIQPIMKQRLSQLVSWDMTSYVRWMHGKSIAKSISIQKRCLEEDYGDCWTHPGLKGERGPHNIHLVINVLLKRNETYSLQIMSSHGENSKNGIAIIAIQPNNCSITVQNTGESHESSNCDIENDSVMNNIYGLVEETPSYNNKAAVSALSYVGTFLRQSMGLLPQPPHERYSQCASQRRPVGHNNIMVRVCHVPNTLGVTQSEIDYLTRRLWRLKFTNVLELLNMTLTLIEERPDLMVSGTSRDDIYACVEHLQQALNGISNHRSVMDKRIATRTPMHHINSALVLAKKLKSDATIVEPMYLSPEQLFGVFGALLIPLVLPFIIGLLREWKRYRKLINIKNH